MTNEQLAIILKDIRDELSMTRTPIEWNLNTTKFADVIEYKNNLMQLEEKLDEYIQILLGDRG